MGLRVMRPRVTQRGGSGTDKNGLDTTLLPIMYLPPMRPSRV